MAQMSNNADENTDTQEPNNSNESYTVAATTRSERQILNSFVVAATTHSERQMLNSFDVVANAEQKKFEDSTVAPLPTNEEVDGATSSNTQKSSMYDLKNYKHDRFIEKLQYASDPISVEFNSPSGICSLPDDRLLLANYGLDCVLLFDIHGVAHQVYKNILSPKDVQVYPSTPHQAVVSIRKALVLLDLEKSVIISKTDEKGFYPWNIQYQQDIKMLTACDPSGERIVYFDPDLKKVGEWSLKLEGSKEKTYPYAAHIFSDGDALVFTNYANERRLFEYDTKSASIIRPVFMSIALESYSIYANKAKQCFLPDKKYHRLLSFDENSKLEEHNWKSVQEPYSLTFLSTGELCISCWNRSYGTQGGIAVISETNVQKQT